MPGSVHVALLRGINVSGKNKLPMAELAAMFENAGCRDVETYIQSGNVVFAATDARAREAPALIHKAISDAYGYRVPVVMRSAAELIQASKCNPFVCEGRDPKSLHVGFLASEPKPTSIAALDPDRSPPDRFHLWGKDIYLCCPNGLARSKLTNSYFDSKLETTSTLRNWRTVLRLAEMADR